MNGKPLFQGGRGVRLRHCDGRTKGRQKRILANVSQVGMLTLIGPRAQQVIIIQPQAPRRGEGGALCLPSQEPPPASRKIDEDPEVGAPSFF